VDNDLDINWFAIFWGVVLEVLRIFLTTPGGLIAVALFVLVLALAVFSRRLTDRWDREDAARRRRRTSRRR